MKKMILLCFFILMFTSCGTGKIIKETIDEPLISLKGAKYDLWNFSNNGKSESIEKSEWETRNIMFTDSTLLSDGIYENSGRFTSEKAFIFDKENKLNKKSIAIRFRFKKGYPKKENYLPILVKGQYYRCLKVIASENEIKISVNGNFLFTIPNEDINTKKLKFNSTKFNILYLSWNIDDHLFYVALNNDNPQKISIPKDFKWEKCGKNWTIQDYSNGTAFKGELDYLLLVNEFLNRKSMTKIIKENNKL
jgi:hypothetical protein